jgi:hypothetical protein
MNQLRKNYDLYALVRALSGVSSFLDNENTKLLELANRRFYEAYQATPMWPRYLLSAEPRTITNQIVSFTQDGFYVFGAGTTAIDGIYKRNGAQDSVNAYTKYDTDGTTALYSLIYVSGTSGEADAQFTIISGEPDSGGDVQYTNADDWTVTNNVIKITVESGWNVNNGTTPAPIVRLLSDVQEFIRMHRSQPFLNNSSMEFDFFVQSDGAHVMNVSSDNDTSIFVTYKKQLPAYLTTWDLNPDSSPPDTEPLNDITLVPNEFFHYIAHATYADFLRMDGQHDKAIIEEQVAEKYLANELEKTDQIANNNTVKKRFHTYVSTQSR